MNSHEWKTVHHPRGSRSRQVNKLFNIWIFYIFAYFVQHFHMEPNDVMISIFWVYFFQEGSSECVFYLFPHIDWVLIALGGDDSSTVKMVNQLLAGVHIASAAEGMAFGARLGLNTRSLYDVILDTAGTSWYISLELDNLLSSVALCFYCWRIQWWLCF